MKTYVKVCKLCGKQFIANSNRAEVCKDVHTSVCAVCGKTFVRKPPYESTTCSRSCAQQLGNIARRATCMKRYGVENPMKSISVVNKGKATCMVRYGVDNVSKSAECVDKIKDTFLSRYGVTNAMQVEEFKQRQRATVFEHFGVSFPLQSSDIMNKVKHTNLSRYGVTNPAACPSIRSRIQQDYKQRTGYTYVTSNPEVKAKIRSTCLHRYGVPYNCMRPECRSSYRTISKLNKAFNQILAQNGITCIMEFPLDRFSYDFKIDNILVEIDPSITHNSAMSIFKDTVPTAPDYHLRKSEVALEHGYRCIHVFDWDDWHKVIQLLLPTEAVYARKCELQKIDKVTADKFTAEYHISGRCNGQVENYGLFFNGELIEVMTFGKPRYNKNYDYELLRLCTKSGLRAVGGASRLFHQFVVEHPRSSIISYCDRAKFTGRVYEQIGMKLVKATEPYKVWSRDDKKITQNLLNQRGYDQLFGTSFGKGTSNEDLMLSNGWLPVYDCGQLVYEYIPQSL